MQNAKFKMQWANRVECTSFFTFHFPSAFYICGISMVLLNTLLRASPKKKIMEISCEP